MKPADRALQSLVLQLGERPNSAPLTLVVESVDGSERWEASAGHAATKPFGPDSPYFVASVTKMVVAALVFRAIDDGRLALNTRLVDVVEADLSGLQPSRGHVERVTVEHALSHRSGFANYLEDKPRGGSSLLSRVLTEGDREWGLDDIVSISSTIGAKFAPGHRQRAHYSDTNFQLLGAALENVCGASLADLVHEQVAKPLGLTNTRMFVRGDSYDGVVAFHDESGPRRLPLLMASVGADGGLVSTANDSVQILRAFNTGRLFDPAMLDAVFASWRRIFFPFRYGFGVMRFHPPRAMTGFVPIDLVGHSGASGAVLFHARDQDVYVSGTVNRIDERSMSYKLMIRALVAWTKAHRQL